MESSLNTDTLVKVIKKYSRVGCVVLIMKPLLTALGQKKRMIRFTMTLLVLLPMTATLLTLTSLSLG
jgi:hypothetical protein